MSRKSVISYLILFSTQRLPKNYREAKPKVDSRWPNGTPVGRKISDRRRTRLTRLNTTGSIFPDQACEPFVDPRIPIEDDAFEEKVQANLKIEESEEEEKVAVETVSEHFRVLFDRCESFAATATRCDSTFIYSRIEQMKETMQRINVLFDDVVSAGIFLENYLDDRQNNNCNKEKRYRNECKRDLDYY